VAVMFVGESYVSPHPEERQLRRVSKDEATVGASWFETRVPRSSP
jgi:hypothetical protein